MGGYYSTSAERVDLLGYYRGQTRDPAETYFGNARQGAQRHAPPVLLGRLYAPPKKQHYLVAYKLILLRYL